MLNENLKAIRNSKGLSQEELAVKLNVVRQTISKWENGLSVPDSDMLIAISEALETSVSTLLGETAAVPEAGDLKAISEKLEIINLQLAQKEGDKAKNISLALCLCMCGHCGGFCGLDRVKQPLFRLGLQQSGNGRCGSRFSCG